MAQSKEDKAKYMRDYYAKNRESCRKKIKCGCCGEFFSPEPSGVKVDHDHECCDRRDGCCGECLRSPLCPRCNRGLGAFGDDISLLAKAIVYLQRWRRV